MEEQTSQPHTHPEDVGVLQARIIELEQALAAEQAQRVYHERLLSSINDAVVIVDRSLRVLEWNAAAERLYGWSSEEVRGQSLELLVKTRYLGATSTDTAQQVADEQGVWQGLVVHLHRNGNEMIIESSVQPLYAPSGQIIGYLGVNRDVTTREQALDALRQSEAVLRTSFDSGTEAVVLLDTNYRVLAFNRLAADETENIYHRRIRHGDDMRDFLSADNTSQFLHYYQQCLRGKGDRSERLVMYPSGERTWYELAYTPIMNADQSVVGVALSAHNTTARKRTELALAEREAQLSSIIDSVMDAVIVVDAEQRIVLFNRTAEQVFGCVAENVLGKAVAQFIPVEFQQNNLHNGASNPLSIEQLWNTNGNGNYAVRADGSVFPIEATVSQTKVGNQQLSTIMLRDISERRQLEAQLIQSQKLESVGRLAGGIAHDFNNLLTAISGAAELAQSTLPPDHAAAQDLEEIQQTVEHGAALTRRLLAFARQQVLAPRITDLNKLIRDMEPLLRRLLGSSVGLQIETDVTPVFVMADATQLEQVMLNLAINARDAMPTGGMLHITTELTGGEAASEATSQHVPRRFARILVQDNGEGIAAEVLPHIFEPFFTTKSPDKGSGLGLATSYGIIVQHGGCIKAISLLGQGTSFTIDLPAAETPSLT